jgi:hypothetical protein
LPGSLFALVLLLLALQRSHRDHRAEFLGSCFTPTWSVYSSHRPPPDLCWAGPRFAETGSLWIRCGRAGPSLFSFFPFSFFSVLNLNSFKFEQNSN